MTWIKPMLEALFKLAPEVLDLVEDVVRQEKAKRVDEIRPQTSHSQQAIDEIVPKL